MVCDACMESEREDRQSTVSAWDEKRGMYVCCAVRGEPTGATPGVGGECKEKGRQAKKNEEMFKRDGGGGSDIEIQRSVRVSRKQDDEERGGGEGEDEKVVRGIPRY